MNHKLVSTSADRTIVTWHFKRGYGDLLPVESDEIEGVEDWIVGEEREGQKQEETAAWGDSSNDVEYQYKPPKYYTDLPLKSVTEDCADCCGFAYNR